MRDWSDIEKSVKRIPETIVVTGPVYSGKTTVAELLAAHHRSQGRRVLLIHRLSRYNEEEVQTALGPEGVLIFDCAPPEHIARHPLVRYITCGVIL